VDRDLSDPLTSRMPVVPHEAITGVDCCGCIVAVVEGTSVELQCNECGAVVGVVQIDILRGLRGLNGAEATCPNCGKLNMSPGFSGVSWPLAGCYLRCWQQRTVSQKLGSARSVTLVLPGRPPGWSRPANFRQSFRGSLPAPFVSGIMTRPCTDV
jgi:hypothetical protein